MVASLHQRNPLPLLAAAANAAADTAAARCHTSAKVRGIILAAAAAGHCLLNL
jgi:hypothetical protein